MRAPRPPSVATAATSLLEEIETLSGRATTAVMESIPSYREHHDELARSVRHTVRTFLDYAQSGIAPSELALARLRDVGRRRAEGRVPLSDVLHAFRMSARAIIGGLADLPQPLPPDAVLWLSEAVLAFLDDVSTLVTDRYAETQADMIRAQDARRREFLSDLLHGHRSGSDAMAEASALGIELLGESRVLVIGLPDPAAGDLPDDSEQRVDDVIAPTPTLAVRIAGDLVVLPLGGADVDAITRALPEIIVGEGRMHPGLDGIRQSYAEARDALAIARATGIGPVASFRDLVLDRLLRQDPALLAEFVGLTVGTIQAYDSRRHTDLLHTLEVWAGESGSPTAAAERLNVHPHTVSYRLGRIEELTGLTLSDPEDRLQLLLGLRAVRLLGSSVVPSPKLRTGDSGAGPGEPKAKTRR